VQNTLPSRGHFRFCWSSTDVDGPIVDYTWRYFNTAGTTTEPDRCVEDTGVLGDFTTGVSPLTVKARDIYNQVETPADTVYMQINFLPSVDFVDDQNISVPTGLYKFWFTGNDEDSDPDSLSYKWQLDSQTQTSAVLLDPDSLFVPIEFTTQDLGNHALRLWAEDNAGFAGESEEAVLFFNVVP
jgi:hypothetical protein